MRTNIWLAGRLESVHQAYFPDLSIQNTILVRFGRSCKNRFGSIILRKVPGHREPVSLITVNAHFRKLEVPEFVIDATLAHELTHYCHGFHSPLPRQYRYPHQGGIVTKELKKRGAGEVLKLQNRWIRQEYRSFLQHAERHTEYIER